MSAAPHQVPEPAGCSVCGAPLDAPHASDRCPACYERGLRQLDADFLDNYARFGARSRQVVAEACLRSLVLGDVSDRKLLAIAIYEQFTGAATEFLGLYHALRERRDRPIVQGVLGFSLDTARAVAFFEDLESQGPTDLLHSLGLPHPDQIASLKSDLDARERKQVREALREALADLERVQSYREIGERALIGAARGLGSTKALTERTEWLVGRQIEQSRVAALALNAESRHLEVAYLSTDEHALEGVVDGIDVMTRLTRNLIFAFVSLHGPAQFRDGFRFEPA